MKISFLNRLYIAILSVTVFLRNISISFSLIIFHIRTYACVCSVGKFITVGPGIMCVSTNAYL